MSGENIPFLGIYMNKCTRRVDSIFTTSVIIIWAILWGDVSVGMVTRCTVFKSVLLYVNNETNDDDFKLWFYVQTMSQTVPGCVCVTVR